MKKQIIYAFIMLLIIGHSLSRYAGAESANESERVAVIGSLQQQMPGFAFSSDGTHAIIGFSAEGVKHYEIDGKPGKDYEDCTRPIFSADSKHWAYAGKKNGKWQIVTDQAEYGPYDGVGGCTAPCPFIQGGGVTFAHALICMFSKDGKRFAFAAGQGDQWVVVLDGKPQGLFESIGINSLTFDDKGSRFAFWGKKNGKWFLVINGQTQTPTSDDLAADWCVLKGNHAFWAVKEGSTMALIRDGEKLASGSAVGKPVCSADGTLWLASIAKDSNSYLLTNGEVSSAFEKIVDGPVLSPDGQHYAFAAKKAGSVCLVRDGKEVTLPFSDVAWFSGEWVFMGESPPVLRFSPDSKVLALATKQGDKQTYVVINDNTYGPYEDVATIDFSPDSKRTMFIVKKGNEEDKTGKSMVVLDDAEGEWYDQVAFPCFSMDGKHFVYAAKTSDQWQVILDGVARPTQYQDIKSVLFTPNGELIVSAGLFSKKSVVYAGDKAGKEWDVISRISSDNFDKSGNLNYLAVADNKLHRITRTFGDVRKGL